MGDGMTGAPANRPDSGGFRIGFISGTVAALSWAIYNVGAKVAAIQGFQAQDLMLARYIGAGLLMLPLLLRVGWRDLGGVGWGRALILTALIGPSFGFIVSAGFVLAPLAHGIVIGPSMTMIASSLLAYWFAGEPLSGQRLAGIGVLMAGLVAIAWDGFGTAIGTSVALGDLAFATSAWLWGGFTLLINRWRIDPLRGTSAVCVLSMVMVVPFYAAAFDMPELPIGQWTAQAVLQGALGGCLAVFSFGIAVKRLGPVRASLFPSMVPPIALLLAIPVLAQTPTIAQGAGVVLATIGLIVGMGVAERSRSGGEGPPEPPSGR